MRSSAPFHFMIRTKCIICLRLCCVSSIQLRQVLRSTARKRSVWAWSSVTEMFSSLFIATCCCIWTRRNKSQHCQQPWENVINTSTLVMQASLAAASEQSACWLPTHRTKPRELLKAVRILSSRTIFSAFCRTVVFFKFKGWLMCMSSNPWKLSTTSALNSLTWRLNRPTVPVCKNEVWKFHLWIFQVKLTKRKAFHCWHVYMPPMKACCLHWHVSRQSSAPLII